MASWINSVRVWPLIRQHEIVLDVVPIQLVTLGMRRYPDLVNRRVGADDELSGRLFELDGQRAAVEIGLEVGAIGSRRQPSIQSLQRLVGPILEFLIVHHINSTNDSEPNMRQHSACTSIAEF